MLIIRLQRVGKKNQPSFRLVLIDSRRATKSGSFLEILGSHDRLLKTTKLKEERIRHWLSKGVQVSDTVHNLLVKKGLLTGPKKDVSAKKKGGSEEKAGVENKKAEVAGAEKPEEKKPAEDEVN